VQGGFAARGGFAAECAASELALLLSRNPGAIIEIASVLAAHALLVSAMLQWHQPS
jgi:hypothetical protein